MQVLPVAGAGVSLGLREVELLSLRRRNLLLR